MNTQSQLARLGLFDARVPRYTSYPTAPQFSADVGESSFSQWVTAIPDGSEISLYVHVPFCRRLCWFCACRTQGTSSGAPVRAYLDTLLQEIAMLHDTLPEGVTLARLHWGGGTPTLLPPEMITELARAILSRTPMAKNGEFSVEIDPNEIDEARADALVAAGMNRVSIGVQDFDPEIQGIIGRLQSYEVTRDAIEMLRVRGITSLNADILFGLPHQNTQRIAESVQKLLSLTPDRVALFGYAHVPWMAKRQQMIPSDTLPTPQERLTLFETARQLFMWDGYREIGIDHFARAEDGLDIARRTGQLRRNFQGYTDDTSQVLIGLGASAISQFPQGYAQNSPATSDYTKRIRSGQFATTRGHVFAGEDKLRGRIIEAIMCDFKVTTSELCARFNVPRATLDAMFEPLSQQFPSVVDVTGDGFSIRPEAQQLARIIARSFDAYDLSKAGHSSAI